MRRIMLVPALMFASAVVSNAASTKASGDYIEARTCSVYTGACHANGEAVTTGREAMLVWHVNQGSVEGVKVDGLTAVAVISGKANLGATECPRDSVIYVDKRANREQRAALESEIRTRYAAALGRVLAVREAPIDYMKDGLEYVVRIPDTAYLKTTRYSCEHCVMPHQVWYEPFVGLKSSLVAKAAAFEFKGSPEIDTRWRRMDENNSFVGEFAF